MAEVAHFNSKYIFSRSIPLILRLVFCFGGMWQVDIDAYLFASFFSFLCFSPWVIFGFLSSIFSMHETGNGINLRRINSFVV